MNNHLNELKYTIFYIILSWFITSLVIFIYKEWFWYWLLYELNWLGYPVIVTNMLEGVLTYIKMSIYLGFYISSISSLLLWKVFIGSGQYNYESKRWWYYIIWIVIINILIVPIVSNLFSNMLLGWDTNLFMLGKMSELLNTSINIWLFMQLLWIVPIILNNSWIRKIYINNRKIIWLVLYILISSITPPDLYITMCIIGPMFLLIELRILWG